jgi:hypothetical protein
LPEDAIPNMKLRLFQACLWCTTDVFNFDTASNFDILHPWGTIAHYSTPIAPKALNVISINRG